MQIRQLQVAHDSIQDRLLIRVATQANEEYRVWLTRRFLTKLWPILAGKLVAAPITAPSDSAAEQPSFSEPFRDDEATYPLGATPLLSSEIKFDAMSDGSFTLLFREGRERTFQLHLNADLLQALCAMLRAGAAQAEWQLPLDYTAEAKPVEPTSPPTSTRLH
jgi:hypothetical protein